MPTHLDRSSLTVLDSLSCQLVSLLSDVDCPFTSSFANSFSRSFIQILLCFLTHFRSRRYRGLRPLFGFAPKQTKGSSAWRTTYIVLQSHKRTSVPSSEVWFPYICINTSLDKNIWPPSKMKKKYCLQFLSYQNQIYERQGIKTIKFKIRNFNSFLYVYKHLCLILKFCFTI